MSLISSVHVLHSNVVIAILTMQCLFAWLLYRAYFVVTHILKTVFLVVLQSVDMAGHNTSLFVLGVMILWFGWYGFNPGSQLAIVTPTGSTYSIASAVSNAAVTTSLAPAAAGLTGLFVTAILLKVKTGKHHWDIMAMGNSTLAGLVAITAGCSTVYPWAAIAIGIVSGFIYPLASRLMVLIRVSFTFPLGDCLLS